MPERLGGNVIDLNGVSKAYGDKLLFEDLSFSLPPGGIVGVIGPNGAGKTTLFRLIRGDEQPDAGEIKIGPTVHLGYVDQSRDALHANKNVWEEISDGSTCSASASTRSARGPTSARSISAGPTSRRRSGSFGRRAQPRPLGQDAERGRQRLLLDEPTNDLDVETLRALEEALENFAGCAVIISHDRFFLDRLATHILAFEGDSHVEWFEGNFEAYEEDKRPPHGPRSRPPASDDVQAADAVEVCVPAKAGTQYWAPAFAGAHRNHPTRCQRRGIG